ncbi:MAG: S41 family peptidase, partial [Acidimicrobiia bacterium]
LLPPALAPEARLIVLINRGAASAAEVLAGALRDRRGAVLVGTPTFGRDANQIAFPLRNGGELHLTIAHWATPGGSTPSPGSWTGKPP